MITVLSACGGGQKATPTPEEAVSPPTATVTVAATPVPPPEEQATVPPPVIENPGPAATLTPLDRNGMYDAPPPMTIDPDSTYYYATIKTNRGDIKAQLFAERAPHAVNNFVFLAREGFYDGTTFHRVLDGFMAQAGDPTATGTGGPGYTFDDELYPGLVFDQSGLLAMANSGTNTNGSQFFITFGPAEWLNGGYTIFGKVIEGEDVLGQITRRDPEANPDFPGDTVYTVVIEESAESILSTPTPSPPTPTPTSTPTPYAPTELEGERPLGDMPAVDRVNLFNQPPDMVIDETAQYTATFRTSKGDFVVQLYTDLAPIAVNNFVVLANLGFYDQTPISLVQPNDSIIIGAPDNNPLNDAGYKLPAETGKVAGNRHRCDHVYTHAAGRRRFDPEQQQPTADCPGQTARRCQRAVPLLRPSGGRDGRPAATDHLRHHRSGRDRQQRRSVVAIPRQSRGISLSGRPRVSVNVHAIGDCHFPK